MFRALEIQRLRRSIPKGSNRPVWPNIRYQILNIDNPDCSKPKTMHCSLKIFVICPCDSVFCRNCVKIEIKAWNSKRKKIGHHLCMFLNGSFICWEQFKLDTFIRSRLVIYQSHWIHGIFLRVVKPLIKLRINLSIKRARNKVLLTPVSWHIYCSSFTGMAQLKFREKWILTLLRSCYANNYGVSMLVKICMINHRGLKF